MEKTIICIGREYGSGGHAIGQILAKRTGYEFYDKDRFIAIAKERGFEGEVEEYLEEQPMNSLLYSIALNYSRPKKKPFPFELVEELAAEKPCIIIGRCAGYLTHGQDNARLKRLTRSAVLSVKNSQGKSGDSQNIIICLLIPHI